MNTTEVSYRITYYLSDDFRDSYFEKHGERPDADQTLDVSAKELDPKLRTLLEDEVPGRGKTDEHKNRRLRVPSVWRSRTRIRPHSSSSYLRECPKFLDLPKISEPSASSIRSGKSYKLDRELSVDDLADVIPAFVDEWESLQREYEEMLEEDAEKVLALMKEYDGRDGEDDRLKEPLVVKSTALSRFSDTSLYDELKAQKEANKEVVEARKERKKRRKEEREKRKRQRVERRKEEREEWIQEHGSDLLRDARAEGYDCQRRYAIERVRKEHDEAFYLDFDGTHEYKERSCPSEEAFRFAQETSGKVVWLVTPGEERADEDRASSHLFEPCEAVVKRITLGEHGKSYTLIREFA